MGGIITGLRAVAPRPGSQVPARVFVAVDGREEFAVPAELVQDSGLRVGQHLDDSERRRLEEAGEKAALKAKVLRFLAFRERSRREVTDRLTRYGAGPETADEIASWLEDLGYLDDERFARAYAREKAAGGWGPRRIKAELFRKGLPAPVTDRILEELNEHGPEGAGGERNQQLVAMISRRFGRELGRDPVRGRRRAADFLRRRGHDWGRIDQVLRQVQDETRIQEPPGAPDA